MSQLGKVWRKNVLLILEAEGISQRELARRMDVASVLVNKYLRGESTPGLEMVERFAKALKRPPLALLDPKFDVAVAA